MYRVFNHSLNDVHARSEISNPSTFSPPSSSRMLSINFVPKYCSNLACDMEVGDATDLSIDGAFVKYGDAGADLR